MIVRVTHTVNKTAHGEEALVRRTRCRTDIGSDLVAENFAKVGFREVDGDASDGLEGGIVWGEYGQVGQAVGGLDDPKRGGEFEGGSGL